jgi:uncharacterized protein involved in exopolysaccharide biosynthesis
VSVETWNERDDAGATAPAAPRVDRLKVQLGPVDVALQLWRSKWLMFLILVLFTFVGVGASLAFPTKYTAHTRLLVTLGQEYVFDPIVGEAAKGAFPQQEEMLQAEAELALSPVIAERVINEVGLAKIYPRLSPAAGADAAKKHALMGKAVETFGKDLSATSAPKSSILRLSFAHVSPQVAADVLNAVVKTYMAYRREVLMGRDGQGLSAQRIATETRLKTSDEVLQAYLKANGVTDFEAEKASVTKLSGALSDEKSTVESSLREAQGRAAGLARQLNGTQKQIDLYTESTSEQDLMKLKLQREDLLTRYKADSKAVKDLDARIAQMDQFLTSRPASGLRRIGPNPTYQLLENDVAAARANAEALSGRLAEISRQRTEVDRRRVQLAALEPEVERLTRERDALEASAKTLATREQTERARSELAAQRADNISIYEPARAPAEGASPKRLVMIAGALFGLATALMIGLMRAWRATTFPTAGALERTLGLRTLATVRRV